MKCMQPNVAVPVDFTGDHLNVMIGAEGRVWVCIDGESVFRAKGLKEVTVEDNRTLLVEADLSAVEDRVVLHMTQQHPKLTEILMFAGREMLAKNLGVAAVDDGLYRLCKALRTAFIYNAEPRTLLSMLERHIGPLDAVRGAVGTQTAPEGQMRLVEAVCEAVEHP